MPTLLHIETATNICSVALSRNGQLLSLRESSEKNAHSAVLTSFIEECFKSAGIKITEIDAVAVSKGPGSYTGLRIGVASAKGLSYALDKPLISVPTLKSMASGMLGLDPVTRHASRITLLCPMIDARRMEVFSAIYDLGIYEMRETRAEIIDETSFADKLKDHIIFFAGDGSAKCKPSLEKNENAYFLDDFRASAKYMIDISEKKFINNDFETLACFEPYYLKDFVAGKPRVKGLI
jgi:tRNA threonylcarbamoyladenosine biosynthesis protein TsaB